MTEIVNFAQNLAREAGRLLADKLTRHNQIYYKGTIDLVTEADKMSEELILAEISRRFPEHGILSEESAAKNEQASMRWIIDPLDGTTNYAHGFPFFCVSIALEQEGVVIMGVIYDPTRDDLFFAQRAGGAYLNGKKLQVSSVSDLSRSLLSTGFPYDIRVSPDNNLNYFSAMAVKAQAIRRAGAAALDLAYLAAGRFDGFWELKLKPLGYGRRLPDGRRSRRRHFRSGRWKMGFGFAQPSGQQCFDTRADDRSYQNCKADTIRPGRL